jgi:hypothetical protein
MSQRIIYSGTGKVRGHIEEGSNTQLYIYSRQGKMLGYYNKNMDRTFDQRGRYVGPGDQRMTLLED